MCLPENITLHVRRIRAANALARVRGLWEFHLRHFANKLLSALTQLFSRMLELQSHMVDLSITESDRLLIGDSRP